MTWELPKAGNFFGVPFLQTYGGQAAPFTDSTDQIRDALKKSGVGVGVLDYLNSNPIFGNFQPRYDFKSPAPHGYRPQTYTGDGGAGGGGGGPGGAPVTSDPMPHTGILSPPPVNNLRTSTPFSANGQAAPSSSSWMNNFGPSPGGNQGMLGVLAAQGVQGAGQQLGDSASAMAALNHSQDDPVLQSAIQAMRYGKSPEQVFAQGSGLNGGWGNVTLPILQQYASMLKAAPGGGLLAPSQVGTKA